MQNVQNIGPIRSLLAVLFVLLGIFLCITIIGIIPGLGCFFFGYLMMHRNIECSNCGNSTLVTPGTKSVKCKDCGNVLKYKFI